jgi:segregation and condensation protein B
MENLKAIIETLIFASDAPLPVVRIRELLEDCERELITAAISELVKEYEDRQGGLLLQEVAGGYQFRTNPQWGAWVKKMKGGKPTALSQPALETLAIIAYRQPVVKADVERMRGVDVSGPLRGLLDKKLVKMVGRKDVPGKPMLYGTTKKFLEVFNLADLSELPTLRELKELQDAYEEQERQKRRDTSDSEELPFDRPDQPQNVSLENEGEKFLLEEAAEVDALEDEEDMPVEALQGLDEEGLEDDAATEASEETLPISEVSSELPVPDTTEEDLTLE